MQCIGETPEHKIIKKASSRNAQMQAHQEPQIAGRIGLDSGRGIRSARRGVPALLWRDNVGLRRSSIKQNWNAEDKPGRWLWP